MKPIENLVNILPYDGEVYDYSRIFDEKKCLLIFNELMTEVPWQQDEVIMFGKKRITNRKMAWYADDGRSYKYSNSIKTALPFTAMLAHLRNYVEETTKSTYNACLLNLYHHGNEGMGWHSDNETSILKNSSIASVSFGAERKFVLKHKTSKQSVSVILRDGSLIEMKGVTQQYWLHSLPKTKKVVEPRINLTFRKML